MNQGYVYFFAANDARIKIGRSANPRSRWKYLSSKAGHHLEVVGIMFSEDMQSEEAEVHRRFVDHHLGNEWFDAAEVLARLEPYKSRFVFDFPDPTQKLISDRLPPKVHQIGVAVSHEDLLAWKEHAYLDGRKLSDWIRRACDVYVSGDPDRAALEEALQELQQLRAFKRDVEELLQRHRKEIPSE